MNDFGLRGKVAVVTGSSKGAGAGIAQALAERGAKVIVNGTIEQDVRAVAAQIRSGGGEAAPVVASVATMEGAKRIIGTAVERFGRLDILVNNAGGIRSHTILEMTEEEWDSVIAVQLKGAFNCAKLAALQMVRQGRGGRIVNIAGAAGVRGMYANANHAASKGGMLAATQSWALELEPHGIAVNAVRYCVRTKTSLPLIEEVKAQLRSLGRPIPPTDRDLGFYEAEEAAPLVVWLVSDDARSITGQYIGIDGPKVTLWGVAQPLRVLHMFPQWTVESLQQHFKPVLQEVYQRSFGVLEVVPALGHLTPEIQEKVEASKGR